MKRAERHRREVLLEQDVRRLLSSSQVVEAPRLREEEIRAVLERAAVTGKADPGSQVPLWALAVPALCLAALGFQAAFARGNLEGPMVLSLLLPAFNLALSPLAALIIVRSRRSNHAQ